MLGALNGWAASLGWWIATYPGNILLLMIAFISIGIGLYIIFGGKRRRKREAQMAGVVVTSRLRRKRR